MSERSKRARGVSRRTFMRAGAAGVAGGFLSGSAGSSCASGTDDGAARPVRDNEWISDIYHARNGTPVQNVAKVIEMAYGGIENLIGPNDVVLLRPNLQWARNGYTNSDIGWAVIDMILRRPGGFAGEIIVIENQNRPNPHDAWHSGWCTPGKDSNGSYTWFELLQYFADHRDAYPDSIHTDPQTGHINLTFQFLTRRHAFTLSDPYPAYPEYSGYSYAGATEHMNGRVDPFMKFKTEYADKSCFYVSRTDLVYGNSIARVPPLDTEFEMTYPVFKSQHSGLYVSLYKEHTQAWAPETEAFVDQPVKLINLSTLNHHGDYAGVTSVVKSHFGMADPNFHTAGSENGDPPTFWYAGGAIGYWLETIRKADLHMSCAEYVGTISRNETDAYQPKSVAISTDPVALDYYAGKYILMPGGGPYGAGGAEVTEPWSNDPDLPGGYYRLTLEYCHDPLADHSIINGTLNEEKMAVRLHDFDAVAGDLDSDGDVDLADFAQFTECHGGPGAPAAAENCERAYLDGDGDVDLADYIRFLDEFGA